jgi:hypothetical protein
MIYTPVTHRTASPLDSLSRPQFHIIHRTQRNTFSAANTLIRIHMHPIRIILRLTIEPQPLPKQPRRMIPKPKPFPQRPVTFQPFRRLFYFIPRRFNQLMILPPRGVQLLSDVVGQYSQTKQLWTVVMLLLLTLCFARFAALLFRQNARRYAVLLVSGASQGQMLRIVLSGMLTMALISNVLAYAITYMLIGVKYRLSLAALSLALDAAVSMIMFQRYIQTSEKAVSILERE